MTELDRGLRKSEKMMENAITKNEANKIDPNEIQEKGNHDDGTQRSSRKADPFAFEGN